MLSVNLKLPRSYYVHCFVLGTLENKKGSWFLLLTKTYSVSVR